MPRPQRVFFDGAVYHVYNRIARGERVLGVEEGAAHLVALLKEATRRDQDTVLAWCVMANHYHLAVQTGPISLDRTMRSVQQRFTRRWNARNRVFGPLWQGRYRAKLIEDQRYLDRLVVYIHLNPVAAGIVDDPAEYPWSGHGELLGRGKDPLVEVDEVLRLFGGSRRTARARYVRALRGALTEQWIGESPGRLPWWRLGRPPANEDEDPEESGRSRRAEDAVRRAREPRDLGVDEFLERGARWLGVELDDLRGRGRGDETVCARELLASVGAERFGLRVKVIAEALGKHPATASGWVMRGIRRRQEDGDYRARYEGLERELKES